jgi:Glycosyl hydrolase family 9
VSLKEVGPSLTLVALSLLAFVCGLVNFNVDVNAPKAIALCWVLYNAVPHALVLVYVRFGAGAVLHRACAISCVAQSLISLLALALLWVLYPRDEDYARAADLSLGWLYAQWSGKVPDAFPVTWRDSSGLRNVLPINITRMDPLTGALVPEPERRINLSGGYYTEGEVGAVKITTHVAWSTALLAWSLLEFESWWATEPARQRSGLDLVQHGLDYVLACYVPAAPLPGWPEGVEPPFAAEDQMVYLVRPAPPCGRLLIIQCALLAARVVKVAEPCTVVQAYALFMSFVLV